MGKKARARREATGYAPETAVPLRNGLNRPLLALAGAGLALTGYMAWTALGGNPVKGCSIGSSCDIVLSSDWATFLGLPTALWGFFMYAALAATAFVKRADRHWQYAWTLSLFGILFSTYLTVVSLTLLESACPYCLTSLGLMTAIFGLLTWQRPADLADFSWPGWFARTAPVPVVFILLMHLSYTGVIGTPPAPEDPVSRALAEHLTNSGAKFYGAYWCPHCRDQKKFFGAAARRLPYIECSPNGQSRPQAQECNDAGVNGYPTWFIDGKKTDGTVLTPKELAQLSGFKGPM